jgi:hypothetical protein
LNSSIQYSTAIIALQPILSLDNLSWAHYLGIEMYWIWIRVLHYLNSLAILLGSLSKTYINYGHFGEWGVQKIGFGLHGTRARTICKILDQVICGAAVSKALLKPVVQNHPIHSLFL